MSDPAKQQEREKPGLSEVLDWRTWEAWAMFLGVYLGLTALMVGAIILSQSLMYDFLRVARAFPSYMGELVLTMALYTIAALALLRLLGLGSKDRLARDGLAGLWFQVCKSAMDLVIPGFGVILGTVLGSVSLELHARLLGLPLDPLPYWGIIMAVLIFHGHSLLIALLAHRKHPQRKLNPSPYSKGEVS